MSSPGVVAGTAITMTTLRHKKRFAILIVSSLSIDRGASAMIYKGKLFGKSGQSNASRIVALKIFPAMLRESEREMLRRELRAASKVAHHGVLPFLGTAKLSDRTIIVTPFMQNGNLLDYLKANPGADRRALIIQVSEAVSFLHFDARVVHGDLKCQNVLVTDDGDAQVTDFGLSTLLDKEESSMTTTTNVRGWNTLRFAAPELLLGPAEEESAGARLVRPRSKTAESDVYAFGMLVLQAFTGKPPWPQLRHEAVLLKVVSRAIHAHPGDEATLLGLTGTWWEVCLKCWAFEPRLRPTMLYIQAELKGRLTRAPTILYDQVNSLRAPLTHPRNYARTAGCRPMLSVAAMQGGTRFVSGSCDRRIDIWDAASPSSVSVVKTMHNGSEVRFVAASPDGRQISSCGGDNAIFRWDAQFGDPLGQPMTGHTAFVLCVAYSPDGSLIASGSADCTIRLWDASTGEPVTDPFRAHTLWVWSVAFSPDSTIIASGADDRTICLWRVATGELLATLKDHEDIVHSVCFHPQGTWLFSGSADRTIRMWDLGTMALTRTIVGHTGSVNSVAVSPSGDYVVSGSNDGTVRIWHVGTGEIFGEPLAGHTSWVNSVAFLADGKSLASGSWDGTVRIWTPF